MSLDSVFSRVDNLYGSRRGLREEYVVSNALLVLAFSISRLLRVSGVPSMKNCLWQCVVCLLATLCCYAGITSPVEAALVARWRLDEGTGDVFADSVDGFDGFVPEGFSIEWTDDAPENLDWAVSFSGDNSGIETSYFGIGGNEPRTVAFWLKTTATGPNGVVSWGATADTEKWHIRINDNAGNGVLGAIRTEPQGGQNVATTPINDGQWHFIASVFPDGATTITELLHYVDGKLDTRSGGGDQTINTNVGPPAAEPVRFGMSFQGNTLRQIVASMADIQIFDEALDEAAIADLMLGTIPEPLGISGGGETYLQNFDGMGTGGRLPDGWSGVTEAGSSRRAAGLGLTDGFLTVPGSDADGVIGVLNLGGNEGSFSSPAVGLLPTWNAELGGRDANLFGEDDVVADNAADRALGISRVDNDDAGELNFEIEIVDSNLRAFVLDWDLEIWGGDPDNAFRSAEGPGMKADVIVGGTSYGTMTQNLLPGALFDSLEDGGDTDHNATLIDGNVYSVRGMTTGIKEVSGADGAVGNKVRINFNANWNDASGGPNGWFSAVDNVRLRALAPGDADANGVVDVAIARRSKVQPGRRRRYLAAGRLQRGRPVQHGRSSRYVVFPQWHVPQRSLCVRSRWSERCGCRHHRQLGNGRSHGRSCRPYRLGSYHRIGQ